MFVEEFVEVIGSILKTEVLDGCGCKLTNFLRDFLEHEFAQDVVKRDWADQLADMSGKLLGSATLSRDSVEDCVDSFSLGLAVEVPEILEELFPRVLSVSLEEFVDSSVLASGEFGLEK